MFDFSSGELLLIAVAALVFIKPKDLPGVLRVVGQWTGKIRRMAGEFQDQFREAMREAEMADLKKSFDEVREAASGFGSGNIMTSLEKDVSNALRIDDVDKPKEAIAPPAAAAPEAPAVDSGTTEPLAITADAPSPSLPQENAADAPVDLKDAKAS